MKKIFIFLLSVLLCTGCNTVSHTITREDIPAYNGKDYDIELNNNQTYFTSDEMNYKSNYYYLSKLDSLGRSGYAMIVASKDTVTNEERGDISSIHPSGFKNKSYSTIVKDDYCYQRSHILMYKLCNNRFNTNVKRNMITGTSFFNANETYGMLHYEMIALNYVENTNNHLLYRVTPVYEGKNKVAKGVIMEAKSIEDNGKGLEYCVFIYNVQPYDIDGIDEKDYNGTELGIYIDYKTGKTHQMTSSEFEQILLNRKDTQTDSNEENTETNNESENTESSSTTENTYKYILNIHTLKIHRPDCESVTDMKEKNKQGSNETIETLENQGYTPCKACHPEEEE